MRLYTVELDLKKQWLSPGPPSLGEIWDTRCCQPTVESQVVVATKLDLDVRHSNQWRGCPVQVCLPSCRASPKSGLYLLRDPEHDRQTVQGKKHV